MPGDPKLPPFDPASLSARLEASDPVVRLAALNEWMAHARVDPSALRRVKLAAPARIPRPPLPPFQAAALQAKLDSPDPAIRLEGLRELAARADSDPSVLRRIKLPPPPAELAEPRRPAISSPLGMLHHSDHAARLSGLRALSAHSGKGLADLARLPTLNLPGRPPTPGFDPAAIKAGLDAAQPEQRVAALGGWSRAGVAPTPAQLRSLAPALPAPAPAPPFNPEAIRAGLASTDPKVRLAALEAWGATNIRHDPALLRRISPGAVPDLNVPDLPKIDPASLAGRLASADPKIALAALGEMAEVPKPPDLSGGLPALPALTPLEPAAAAAGLSGADPALRAGALGDLMLRPQAAAPLLPQIAALADDPDPEVRELAHRTLGGLGPPAVPALTRGLDPAQPDAVRIAAAAGLRNAGPAAAPATHPLCRCLLSPNDGLRSHAAMALGSIGAPAVPSMRTALGFSEPAAKIAAIEALGHAGPAAAPAVPDLLRLAAPGAAPPAVGLASLSAVGKITGDSSATAPAMLALARDPDAGVRTAAVTRLGEQMEVARPHAPALLPHLNDPDPGVRAATALALGRMNASDPATVGALGRSLQDPDPNVRANAGIALHRFGPAAAPARPALERLRADPDARVAAIASECVKKISG